MAPVEYVNMVVNEFELSVIRDSLIQSPVLWRFIQEPGYKVFNISHLIDDMDIFEKVVEHLYIMYFYRMRNSDQLHPAEKDFLYGLRHYSSMQMQNLMEAACKLRLLRLQLILVRSTIFYLERLEEELESEHMADGNVDEIIIEEPRPPRRKRSEDQNSLAFEVPDAVVNDMDH